jgi:signal peptidase II
MVRRTIHVILLFALVTGVVGCDGATKQIARSHLRAGGPVSIVSGVLSLAYTENEGMAFNADRVIPEGLRKPLVLLSRLAILILVGVIWYRRRGEPLLEHAAYALLVAGAVGNLGEMILRGHVTDFIYLVHWPVFNVADVSIVAGMVLLALASLSAGRRPLGGCH